MENMVEVPLSDGGRVVEIIRRQYMFHLLDRRKRREVRERLFVFRHIVCEKLCIILRMHKKCCNENFFLVQQRLIGIFTEIVYKADHFLNKMCVVERVPCPSFLITADANPFGDDIRSQETGGSKDAAEG